MNYIDGLLSSLTHVKDVLTLSVLSWIYQRKMQIRNGFAIVIDRQTVLFYTLGGDKNDRSGIQRYAPYYFSRH